MNYFLLVTKYDFCLIFTFFISLPFLYFCEVKKFINIKLFSKREQASENVLGSARLWFRAVTFDSLSPK